MLLNLFLEKIILETLHDHKTSISCNLRFGDDDRLGDSSGELQDLTNRLVDRAMEWKIISTEKSKVMKNSTNNISTDVSMNGQKLEEVTSF